MARLARFVLPLLVLLAGCQSPGDKTTPAAEGTSATASKAAPTAAGVCADEPVAASATSCGDTCEGETACKGGCGSCGCSATTAKCNAELVPAEQAKVGDRTRCPVSGGVFVVRPDTVRVDVGGHSYPVCCPGCAARLQAHPEKYLDS